MTADAKAASPLAELDRLGPVALLIGVITLLLLAAFQDESRAAVQVWIDSTAYGHCFFVAPIAAYLAWERRDAIAATTVRPLPWLALLALPGALVWFAVERLGIMEGQQLVAMTGLQLICLAALGWQRYRALSVPLLYLFFLVPFGAFLTSALQNFTLQFILVGLDLLGLPNSSDGMLITIPEGRFLVAEACAGLRFLIASIAFGALYACLIYSSIYKRVLFIAASIVIPVVANGFRGLGTVYLGHVLGSAEAAAVDHVLYGWVFFSIVILMLIGAGLPFREDENLPPAPEAAPPTPPATLRHAALAGGMTLALFCLPSLASALAVRTTTPALPPVGATDSIAGCFPAQGGPQAQAGSLVWSYTCPVAAGPVDHLVLRINLLSRYASPGTVLRLRREATGEIGAEDVNTYAYSGGTDAAWTGVETTEPDRVAAYAAWIDGLPARGGWELRIRAALASLSPTGRPPVVITISSPDSVTALSPQDRNSLRNGVAGLVNLNRGMSATAARIVSQP